MGNISFIDLIIIISYLIGMLALGLFAKSQVKDMDDFILGGKRFGVIALTGTVMATMIGSGMTMGSVGNAYKFGLTGNVFYVYLGFSVGLFFFSYIVKKLRDTNKRTMAEIISFKFGRTARLISSIIIIGYAMSIVAINIAGLRTVVTAIFGDSLNLSPVLITVIVTLLAMFYTSTGGLYAVVWMDTIQLGIILLGIIVAGPIIGLVNTGGFGVIQKAYEAVNLSMTNPFINGISAGSLGFFLAYFLTVPADPAMPQRALSGKTTNVVKTAFKICSIIGLIFGASLIIIGASTFVLSPGLKNPEQALTHFIITNYPPVLKGITLIGIFGAIMSSFDSFLVLSTTHIFYDLGGYFNFKQDDKSVKKTLSIGTIIVGLIALVIALYIQSLFAYLYMVFSVVGSALVPALLGGLFFEKKVTKLAANLSMIVGALVPAFLYLKYGYNVFLGDPVFIGIISSTLVIILVSIFTKNKKEEEVYEK